MSLFLQPLNEEVEPLTTSAGDWGELLADAQRLGWSPTEAPENTTYVTNDDAVLSAEDTKSLVEIIKANKDTFLTKVQKAYHEEFEDFIKFLENSNGLVIG